MHLSHFPPACSAYLYHLIFPLVTDFLIWNVLSVKLSRGLGLVIGFYDYFICSTSMDIYFQECTKFKVHLMVHDIDWEFVSDILLDFAQDISEDFAQDTFEDFVRDISGCYWVSFR